MKKHKPRKKHVKVVVAPSTKYPSFSRFITEFPSKSLLQVETWMRFETLRILVVCASAILAVLIGVVGTKLYTMVSQKQELEQKRAVVVKELNYWRDIASRYGEYRDAYFKVALLEYQLGNDNEAKKYLEKALAIDPNFEKGRGFEKLLK